MEVEGKFYMNTKAKTLSPWVVLIVMVMSMTAGALCMNKVAPITAQMITSLGLSSATQAGLLISIFAFAGIVLSIPVGFIITKFGSFKAGLIGILAALIGSVVGALTISYPVLLGSRLLEGVALVFLSTIGPVVTAKVFAPEKRGMAMGILMCYMSVGQILMFNLAPRMATTLGWSSVWWFTAVYSLITAIAWVLFVRDIDSLDRDSDNSNNKDIEKVSISEVAKNKYIWLVGFVFLITLVAQQGVIGFLTTYLVTVRGADAGWAGSIVSIAPMVGIPMSIVAGMISDKMGSRKWPIVICFIGGAVTFFLMTILPESTFFITSILLGVFTMPFAPLCFTAVTEVTVKPEHNGMASAIMNMLMFIGIFISSILFGYLVQNSGWDIAFYAMIGLYLFGAVFTALLKKLK